MECEHVFTKDMVLYTSNPPKEAATCRLCGFKVWKTQGDLADFLGKLTFTSEQIKSDGYK